MDPEMMSELKKILDHQANMESLWVIDNSTIHESILQAALRHIHAIIEGDKAIAELVKGKYWDVDSEL